MSLAKLCRAALLGSVFCSSPKVIAQEPSQLESWATVESSGHFSARHEAGFVIFESKGFLFGGRGIKPVNMLEPDDSRWSSLASSPLELHHFQRVVYQIKLSSQGQ